MNNWSTYLFTGVVSSVQSNFKFEIRKIMQPRRRSNLAEFDKQVEAYTRDVRQAARVEMLCDLLARKEVEIDKATLERMLEAETKQDADRFAMNAQAK